MTSELGQPILANELLQIVFCLECGGDRGLGYLFPLGGSVDAFGPSVIRIGPALDVSQLFQLVDGDLWVVEAISTYEDDGDYYVCLIVEFVDGKVRRETRYYGRPLQVDRS